MWTPLRRPTPPASRSRGRARILTPEGPAGKRPLGRGYATAALYQPDAHLPDLIGVAGGMGAGERDPLVGRELSQDGMWGRHGT